MPRDEVGGFTAGVVNRRIKRFFGSAVLRVAGVLLLAVIVFASGVAIGNGTVKLNIGPFQASAHPELPDKLDFSSVNDVYASLKANYNGTLTVPQLLDGLKEGLAEATHDQYTEYFNPDQAKQFEQELNNSFSGIGAVLGKDDQGNIIIISPIRGFPADKAGLEAKDVIVSINGESTTNMPPDVAAGKIRGPKGTTVTLKVIRNKTEALTFTVTRANIKLPSVTTKTLANNIGYMAIRSFSDDTAQLAAQAAQQFFKAHVKGIVLDLRGDPGGLVDAAEAVSSLWLPDGATIVTEKGTDGTEVLTADGNPVLRGIRTVVLIDGGSASASEITAGALHDNGAAYLIGNQSFGKGVVQQLIQFSDGSELKVTVASWYRPNGQNINKKGITPDKVVNLTDQDTKTGNDLQLTAAEAYLK